MINLMPPETKQAYRYAKSNQKIVKWVVVLIIGLLGLGSIATYGWVTMHQSVKTTQVKVKSIEATLAKENQAGIDSQIQTISNDFNLVVKVLSQEVLFSKLLSKIAAAMPTGANLTGLNITNTSSGAGMDITAEATNYTTATQADANLADPANGIFARTDIVSIDCTPSPNLPTNYPCSIKMRAQFAPNNQFLFINQGKQQQ